jgi:hypothetical protein
MFKSWLLEERVEFFTFRKTWGRELVGLSGKLKETYVFYAKKGDESLEFLLSVL